MSTAVILLLIVNAAAFALWLGSVRVRLIVGLPLVLPLRVPDAAGLQAAWARLRLAVAPGLPGPAPAIERRKSTVDPALQRLADAIRRVESAPAAMPVAPRSAAPRTATAERPRRPLSDGETRLVERMQRLRAAQGAA